MATKTDRSIESVRFDEFKKEIKENLNKGHQINNVYMFKIFKKYDDLNFEKRVNYFLENGCNINDLFYRIISDSDDLDNANSNKIKFLIESKVNINLDTYTTFMSAFEEGKINILKTLIDNKLDINAKNEDGIFLLHEASLFLNKEAVPFVKLLIESKAEVNIVDNGGNNFIISFIDHTMKYFEDEEPGRLKRIMPFLDIINFSDDDVRKLRNLNKNNLLDEIINIIETKRHQQILDIIYYGKN